MNSIGLKEKIGTERRNKIVTPLFFTAFGQEREEYSEEKSRNPSICEGQRSVKN